MPDTTAAPASPPTPAPTTTTQGAMGVVRHFLTALGGALVSAGVLTANDWQSCASAAQAVSDTVGSATTEGGGGIMVLAGIGWSIWQKMQAAKKTAAVAATTAALLLCVGLSGCATSTAVPTDASQALAVIDASYLTAAAAEHAYMTSALADPAVVKQMQAYDNSAFTALGPVTSAMAAGGTVDQATLAAAQAAVQALSDYVTAHQGAKK